MFLLLLLSLFYLTGEAKGPKGCFFTSAFPNAEEIYPCGEKNYEMCITNFNQRRALGGVSVNEWDFWTYRRPPTSHAVRPNMFISYQKMDSSRKFIIVHSEQCSRLLILVNGVDKATTK